MWAGAKQDEDDSIWTKTILSLGICGKEGEGKMGHGMCSSGDSERWGGGGGDMEGMGGKESGGAWGRGNVERRRKNRRKTC